MLSAVATREDQTKWDLMSDADRVESLQAPFGGHCSGCNEYLATEADFARHFLIYRGYRNLGWCPVKGR